MKMIELLQPAEGELPIGAVNMDARDYHLVKAISQSPLKKMALSPAHYKWSIENKTDPTSIMELGTLVHCLVLEPQAFNNLFIVMPDNRQKRGKWWEEEFFPGVKGRVIIKESKLLLAKQMAHAFLSSPMGSRLLNGHKEKSFFWRNFNFYCKGRPDIVHFTAGMLVDLKTVALGFASLDSFLAHAVKQGWHIQAAWYLDGIGMALDQMLEKGIKLPFDFVRPRSFVFAAIERKGPFGIGFYEIPPTLIDEGRKIYQRAMGQLTACLESDQWPCYSDEIMVPEEKAWMFGPIDQTENDEIVDEEEVA